MLDSHWQQLRGSGAERKIAAPTLALLIIHKLSSY
jgi:hypothetical protein